jgi:isoleucyl-tRNA synthetase
VWECRQCKHQIAVGSIAELSKRAGRDLIDLDLHRPNVDKVNFSCTECDGIMQRVPEVIDVWFDSGAMPVAQWHYPFENISKFKEQFPADYICEAVDQTRGWFYSLHAISTLLFDHESYQNVICLGLILDNDGQKMAKSKGNIIDPWDVLDVHGADAFRWYLYTASPPGNERRFSVDLVGEVIRNFTLTLWNVYSFFVTYANLDKPVLNSTMNVKNDLDRWLLSSLHTLIKDVTEAYEQYDVPNATRPIEVFVEHLSTWYLRRSRRRFWKSESDSDKQAAYTTLYTALITVAKLLAPAMPFLAEELYQNLVCSVDVNAPESVHLSLWPEYDKAFIDDTLNHEMVTVMKLVSLGHAARNKADRKVRQPLAEAAFSVGNIEERDAVEAYTELIKDELNVKRVRLLDTSSEAVVFRIKPLPRQLGQKYGNRLPAITEKIAGIDPESAARKILNGQSLEINICMETLKILPDDVEVHAQAREGFAVATEGPYLAAVVTELTPELVREGLAREFVRRIQDLRKQADLNIADRIQIYIHASSGLVEDIQVYQDYIMSETLAIGLNFETPPKEAVVIEDIYEGENISIGLQKT